MQMLYNTQCNTNVRLLTPYWQWALPLSGTYWQMQVLVLLIQANVLLHEYTMSVPKLYRLLPVSGEAMTLSANVLLYAHM